MTQKLNDILCLTNKEIKKAKIEFNMHPANSDEEYIERWLKHTDEEKSSGTCEYCSYWNNRGGKRNYKLGELVFSFVRLSKDEWLFISAGIVTDENANDAAKVEIDNKYSDLFGKLIVNTKEGYVFRRYSYYLKTHIGSITVKDKLKDLYVKEF